MNLIGFFLHTTTLTFVVLKLLDKIDWSWWWVLLPSYGPLSFGLLCYLFGWMVYRFGMTEAERKVYDAKRALKELADAIGRRR